MIHFGVTNLRLSYIFYLSSSTGDLQDKSKAVSRSYCLYSWINICTPSHQSCSCEFWVFIGLSDRDLLHGVTHVCSRVCWYILAITFGAKLALWRRDCVPNLFRRRLLISVRRFIFVQELSRPFWRLRLCKIKYCKNWNRGPKFLKAGLHLIFQFSYYQNPWAFPTVLYLILAISTIVAFIDDDLVYVLHY